MTALCGGGTSSPVPGSPAFVQFAAVALDALLTDAGVPWLIPLLTAFELPILDVATLCSTDPPALPTFTADDALVLVRPWDASSANLGTVTAKIAALIQHIGWYAFCRCDTGSPSPLPNPATPTPPGLPTLVGGQPTIDVELQPNQCKVLDRGVITPSSTTPTGWETVGFNDSAWIAGVNVPFNFTINSAALVANLGVAPRCIQLNPNTRQYVAPWLTPPTGAEAFLVRWRFDLPDFDYSQLCFSTFSLQGIGPFGGVSSSNFFANGVSLSTGSGLANFHSGPNLLAWSVNPLNTSGTNTWGASGGVSAALTLSGSLGGSGQQGCCPPDPSVMQLLRSILEATTLVQRQAAPFGYVQGATHPFLTGSGEIPVSDLIGALITVTASGPVTGIEAGHPETWFEAGWFNWGNADGFAERIRVSGGTQISLPAAAGQYTRIGYTLPVGMRLSITELIREP